MPQKAPDKRSRREVLRAVGSAAAVSAGISGVATAESSHSTGPEVQLEESLAEETRRRADDLFNKKLADLRGVMADADMVIPSTLADSDDLVSYTVESGVQDTRIMADYGDFQVYLDPESEEVFAEARMDGEKHRFHADDGATTLSDCETRGECTGFCREYAKFRVVYSCCRLPGGGYDCTLEGRDCECFY